MSRIESMSRDSRSELFILPAQHERSVIFNGSVDSSVGENGSKVEEAEGRKKLTQLIVQLQLAISAERSRQNISSLRALMQSEGIDASVNSGKLPSPTRVGRLMRRIAILATALSFLGNVGVANAENVKNEPRGKNVAPPNSGDAYSDQFPSSFPYPIEPRSVEDTPSQPYHATNDNISLANPEANHSNRSTGDESGGKGGGARSVREEGTGNHQEGDPSTEASGVVTSIGIHLNPGDPDLVNLLNQLEGKNLDTPFTSGGKVEKLMQELGTIFEQHPELADAMLSVSMNIVGDENVGLDVMADLVQGAEAGGFPAGTIWTKIGKEGRFIALPATENQVSRVRASQRLQQNFALFVTPDGNPIQLNEGDWFFVIFKDGKSYALYIIDNQGNPSILLLSQLLLNPNLNGKTLEAAIEATKEALNNVNAKPVPETGSNPWEKYDMTEKEYYARLDKAKSLIPKEILNDTEWQNTWKDFDPEYYAFWRINPDTLNKEYFHPGMGTKPDANDSFIKSDIEQGAFHVVGGMDLGENPVEFLMNDLDPNFSGLDLHPAFRKSKAGDLIKSELGSRIKSLTGERSLKGKRIRVFIAASDLHDYIGFAKNKNVTVNDKKTGKPRTVTVRAVNGFDFVTETGKRSTAWSITENGDIINIKISLFRDDEYMAAYFEAQALATLLRALDEYVKGEPNTDSQLDWINNADYQKLISEAAAKAGLSSAVNLLQVSSKK